MKMKKILSFVILTFICLTLTKLNAIELSYVETNKTVTDYGNFQKLVYEGVTTEDGSKADQTMSFVTFNTNEHKNLELVHWEYLGTTGWRLRNLLNLAKDYESKNPGYKVLAGINGDFFSMSSPYEPMNTHITNYDLTRSGYDYFDTLGIDNDGKMNMFTNVISYTSWYNLRIYDEYGYPIKEVRVDSLNGNITSGGTVVYVPGYASDIDCTGDVCYNVKSADYTRSSGDQNTSYYILKGTIDNMDSNVSKLSDGQFTIRTSNVELQKYLAIGKSVSVQKATTNDLRYYKSAGGYAGNILKDGNVLDYTTMNGPDHQVERHPRTVLGQKEDGTYMFGVIDGRNASLNRDGVTLAEAGKVLNYYGCVNGVAFDGGGSSTLIVRENNELKVANIVSNSGQELRSVSDGWFLVEKEVDVDLTSIALSKTSRTYKVEFTNKENIQKVYAVHNGEKTEVSLSTKEYELTFTPGMNFLYFEIEYGNDKKITSNLYITDTTDIKITKVPPTNFIITDAQYNQGKLTIKLDYKDDADVTSKLRLVHNGTQHIVMKSTKTCDINNIADNSYVYLDVYYEYFIKKTVKETYHQKLLIVIKDGQAYYFNENNNMIDYLIGSMGIK